MIRELFAAYVASPTELPERFALRTAEQGSERVICDYIAGMTDRFCAREHARLVAK
jgi:dGTPase